MRARVRGLVGCSLLLVVALIAAACGGSDAESSSSVATDSAPAAAAEDSGADDVAAEDSGADDEAADDSAADDSAADDSAADDEAADDTAALAYDPDGAVRIAVTFAPVSLDPHLETPGSRPYWFLLYDRLTAIDNELTVVPMLATSWEFADDSLALEMTLRTDVTFHDGTPFDAEAVKLNIERAKSLDGSTVATALEVVTSVEVIDAATVKFNLSSPYPDILGDLAAGAGAMISPAVLAEDNGADLGFDPGDAGSGPYVVAEAQLPDKVVYERAAGEYWEPGAGLAKTIEISQVPENPTRLIGLQTGEFDVINVQGGDQLLQLDELLPSGDYGRADFVGSTIYGVFLNAANAPLDNLEFRQAIAHAVDRDSIANDLLGGSCEAVAQNFIAGADGYDANIETLYPYDLDKAKELVASSGAAAEFTGTVVQGLRPQNDIATAVQAQLAEAGITWDLQPLANAEAKDRWGDGSIDSFTHGLVGYPTSGLFVLRNLVGGYQVGGAIADEITDQVNAAQAAAQPADRTPIYTDINREVMEQALWVPVCSGKNTWGFASNVLNVESLPWAWGSLGDFRYLAIES